MTNAVIDALRPLGVDYMNMPLSPMRVWEAISRPERSPKGGARMIPPSSTTTAPESLQEAIRALVDGGEDAKLLAGGHSLIPLMKLRLAAPSLLVDLRKVPGLHGVERQNGHWRIGALTPHTRCSSTRPSWGSSRRWRRRSPTRRCATAARSAARWPTATRPRTCRRRCCHRGRGHLQGQSGQRTVAAADLFQDYLTTAVGEDEVLTEVRIPALDGWGYSYQKFNRRCEDWAMVAVAWWSRPPAGRARTSASA